MGFQSETLKELLGSALILNRSFGMPAGPEANRYDNGPELTGRHLLDCCEEQNVQLIHIQPGQSMQNWLVESLF